MSRTVILPARMQEAIWTHVLRELPNEGVGVLAVHQDAPDTLHACYPLSNVAAQPAQHYLADPLELLRALHERGLRLAVLTNYPRPVQTAKLDACGFGPYLHAAVTTSDAPPKPDPASYHAACKALGVQPDQAVMVGDNWHNDVAGAVRADLRAVWYNPAASKAPTEVPHAALAGFLPLETALATLLCKAET